MLYVFMKPHKDIDAPLHTLVCLKKNTRDDISLIFNIEEYRLFIDCCNFNLLSATATK